MKKLFKISGIILAVILSVMVLAVVAVTVLVDPNDYRDDISKIVKEKTGRTLAIKGDLSLKFFPWIGLSIGDTTLSNAKGFGNKPFAHFDRIQLEVKLLPLITRRVEMKKIVIDGVALDLQKNKQGTSNWDDMIARGKQTQKPVKEKDQHESSGGLKGIQIGGIEIINMTLSWKDAQQGKNYEIDNLNLVTGEIESGKPVDMKLSLAVKDKKQNKTWGLKVVGVFSMDPEKKQMQVEKFLLKLANLELRGSVKMTHKDGSPSINASLKSNDFVPRETFNALGIKMPVVSDATVFGKARLALSVSGSPSNMKVNKLNVLLDDTQLDGTLSIAMPSQAIRYNLTVNQIDVDRYLPPPAKKGVKDKKAPAPASDKIDLPMKMLRALNIKGDIKIGKLKAANLRSENIHIGLSAQKGLIRVYPASADLYQGKYRGDISLNAQGSQPVISMNEKLTGVQASPLFKDALDMDWIAGTANLTAKLQTRGNAISVMQKQLNGNISFAFTDGSVKGVNIAQKIRQASAALKGQSAPSGAVEKTDFSSITGTAKVVNGVVDNRDLKMLTPLLRVNGAGTADLGMQTVNYLVKATVVATLEGQGGDTLSKLKGVTVPVRIEGPFAKLKYKVELDSVLKDEVKKKVQKKVEDKLKDKLKGRFKGLF